MDIFLQAARNYKTKICCFSLGSCKELQTFIGKKYLVLARDYRGVVVRNHKRVAVRNYKTKLLVFGVPIRNYKVSLKVSNFVL